MAADAFASGEELGIGGFIEFPGSSPIWFSERYNLSDFKHLDLPLHRDAQRDISCWETLAQVGLMLLFAHFCPGGRMRLTLPSFSDNTGTEAVCAKLLTTKSPLCFFAQLVAMVSTRLGIRLDVRHISGERNEAADLLSRWDEKAPLGERWSTIRPQVNWQCAELVHGFSFLCYCWGVILLIITAFSIDILSFRVHWDVDTASPGVDGYVADVLIGLYVAIEYFQDFSAEHYFVELVMIMPFMMWTESRELRAVVRDKDEPKDVYITKHGDKYHKVGCVHVRDKATTTKYSACSKCFKMQYTGAARHMRCPKFVCYICQNCDLPFVHTARRSPEVFRKSCMVAERFALQGPSVVIGPRLLGIGLFHCIRALFAFLSCSSICLWSPEAALCCALRQSFFVSPPGVGAEPESVFCGGLGAGRLSTVSAGAPGEQYFLSACAPGELYLISACAPGERFSLSACAPGERFAVSACAPGERYFLGAFGGGAKQGKGGWEAAAQAGMPQAAAGAQLSADDVDRLVKQRLEQAFHGVIRKLVDTTERAAQAAEASASTNRLESLTKSLKVEFWKPASREEELKSWKEWAFQFTNWLVANDPSYEADLAGIDLEKEIDHALLPSEQEARSQRLFGVLCCAERKAPASREAGGRNEIPTFPMDVTDNDGQWTLESGLAGAEESPEDWVIVPEVARVLAVQAQSEIVIDSGAHISVAPLQLAGLGTSTRRSGVIMQDAQGNRIPEMQSRILDLEVATCDNQVVTIREKFCVAPIENVILSLGRLLRNTLTIMAMVASISLSEPVRAEDRRSTSSPSSRALWNDGDWAWLAVFVRVEEAKRPPQEGDVWMQVLTAPVTELDGGPSKLVELDPELEGRRDTAMVLHVEELPKDLLSNPRDIFKEVALEGRPVQGDEPESGEEELEGVRLSADTCSDVHNDLWLLHKFVEDVLSMTMLRPHEELLNAGTLVQYEGGSQGSVMFISHQWAGSDHPDPFFEQFKILQEALRKMMSNASGVSANILVEMMYAQDTKGVTAKELTSQPLFLWYDYFSCPQIEAQMGKTREQAISSIAAYVEKCQYFVVLCPHVRHAENEVMLANKLNYFLLQEDFCNYRILLNLQRLQLRGLSATPKEDSGYQNGFLSIQAPDSAGWPPLCYAALDGSPMLVASLLEQRAEVNSCSTKFDKLFNFPPRMSALSICVALMNNDACRVLIEAKADLHAEDDLKHNATHWAALAGNAEGLQWALSSASETLAGDFIWKTHDLMRVRGFLAFGSACMAGSVEATSFLRAYTPQAEIAGSLHVVTQLIDAKADMDFRLQTPLLSPLGLLFACMGLRHRWRASTLSTYAYHHENATPLMCSIITSSFETAAALVAAGARTDLRNSRGCSAADLALEMGAPDFVREKMVAACFVPEQLITKSSELINVQTSTWKSGRRSRLKESATALLGALPKWQNFDIPLTIPEICRDENYYWFKIDEYSTAEISGVEGKAFFCSYCDCGKTVSAYGGLRVSPDFAVSYATWGKAKQLSWDRAYDKDKELFYNVTNPKEELLGDVFELALGMLTLAMRHPEKFDNLGTFHDMNACIQGLECSVYRNCASESIELMSADSPRKRSPPRRIAEIERSTSQTPGEEGKQLHKWKWLEKSFDSHKKAKKYAVEHHLEALPPISDAGFFNPITGELLGSEALLGPGAAREKLVATYVFHGLRNGFTYYLYNDPLGELLASRDEEDGTPKKVPCESIRITYEDTDMRFNRGSQRASRSPSVFAVGDVFESVLLRDSEFPSLGLGDYLREQRVLVDELQQNPNMTRAIQLEAVEAIEKAMNVTEQSPDISVMVPRHDIDDEILRVLKQAAAAAAAVVAATAAAAAAAVDTGAAGDYINDDAGGGGGGNDEIDDAQIDMGDEVCTRLMLQKVRNALAPEGQIN
ncbi:hypothetical protein AK812_SmicGene38133 [Symbiodinium microadriaticum]|uniref:Uncharacterized protein n=2 Tax=Symbiodinium TaxID=2949 RepID=A0A1Q9CEI3_SYMMI|nr:hypothetical protein AK812_SmicGene38133 [Symbiodinium microadriaticum]